jgi:hypothetical protein
MRRAAAFVLTVTLAFSGEPLFALAAAAQTGAVTGVARTSGGSPFVNHMARLRSVRTGEVVASTPTNSFGTFEFSGVVPESYVIEVADRTGKVVGISGVTTVTAGGTAIAAITAATSVVGGQAATSLTTWLVIAAGAGALGIWAATREEASPSR